MVYHLASAHFHFHTARIPDEADDKILAASLFENWNRPFGHPRITWLKTIQDVKSNNLCLNEAINLAQNHPL